MGTNRMRLIFSIFLFLFIVPPICTYATAEPEITRLDATMLENKVSVSFTWKSDAPIVEIRASGGRNLKIINKENKGSVGENINNDRSPKGYYTGKMAIELDSNYVAVSNAYISKRYDSQTVRKGNNIEQSTSYNESEKPVQKAVIVTLQVMDKYGMLSAKSEKIIPAAIEMAPRPNKPQAFTESTSQSQRANPAPSKSIVPNLFGASVDFVSQYLNKIIIREAQLSPDGRLSLIAEVSAITTIQELTYDILDQQSALIVTGFLLPDGTQDNKFWKGETKPLQPGRYRMIFNVKEKKGNKHAAQAQFFEVPDPSTTKSVQPSEASGDPAEVSGPDPDAD